MADPKTVQPTTKEMTDLQAVMTNVLKLSADFSAGLTRVAKSAGTAGKAATEMGSDISHALGDAEDSLTAYTDGLSDVVNEHRSLISIAKKLPIGTVGKFDAEWRDVRATLKDINEMKAKGVLSVSEMADRARMIEDVTNKTKNLKKEMDKAYTTSGAEKKDNTKKHNEEMQQGAEDFVKTLKKGGNPFDAIKGMKIGNKFNVFSKIAGEGAAKTAGAEGASALSGALMKGLAGALGGVGKLLANPIVGAITIAIKAIWNMGMQADNFVKDANKRFASVRGPDIMTTDVKKQFKEFNDQIYNAGENLKVGMNAKQIGEFIAALNQAGTSLDSLNDGFTTYRDVVYVAAKASASLGIDTAQAAGMMNTMFQEYRMSLDKADSALTNVAFDAKKAGLTTDKFWATIQNANASLQFWGISMDKASKTLASFNKTQVMGAGDMGAAVTDVTQAFTKMDNTQRAALLGLSGGVDAAHKAMSKSKKAWEEKVDSAKESLSVAMKTGKPPEVLEKIRTEIAGAQTKISNLDKGLAENDPVHLAPYLAEASDGTIGIIQDLMAKTKIGNKSLAKLSADDILVGQKIFEQVGLPPALLMQLSAITEEMGKEQEGQLDALGSFAKEGVGATIEGQKAVADRVGELAPVLKSADYNSKESIEAQKKVSDQLQESMGVDKDAADGIARILASDDSGEVAKTLQAQLAAGSVDTEVLKKIAKQNKTADKAAMKGSNISNLAQEDLAKNAEKTFNQVRDQTLSFQEMQEIANNEISWRLNSLGIFQALNKGVFDIFNYMVRNDKKYRTKDQKVAEEKLRKGGYAGPTVATNSKEAKQIAQTMMALQKNVEDSTKTSAEADKKETALQKVLSAPDVDSGDKDEGPLKATMEAINGLKTAMPDFNMTEGQTKQLAEINKILSDPKPTEEKKKEAKILAKALKASTKSDVEKQLSEQQKAKDVADKQLAESKTSLDALKSMDDNNGKMLKYQQMMAFGNADVKKDMVATLKEMNDSGMSLEDIQKETGLSAKQINSLTSDSKSGGDNVDWNNKKQGVGLRTASEAAMKKEEKNLDVKRVLSGGMVNVSKGDVVVDEKSMADALGGGKGSALSGMSSPKGIDLMSLRKSSVTPNNIPETKQAAGAGAGGGQSITITVNANEKDLASRIANEVRGVLYKQQVSGTGA